MSTSDNELPQEHHDYVDSLPDEAKAVYKMSKIAGKNIVMRMAAEHGRSEAEQGRKEAEYRADHDNLTGLLNKEAWKKELSKEIETAEKTGKQFGILFIDLKDFKEVNDVEGHDAGDQVLKLSAEVLQATLPLKDRAKIAHERLIQSGDDKAGRLGGDEFAIILDLSPRDDSDQSAQQSLDAVAKRIREMFLSENEFKNLGINMSIGSKVWEPGMTAETMLKTADQAMYVDKYEQKQEFGSYR